MKAHADKKTTHHNASIADTVFQQTSDNHTTSQFADHRSETLQLQNLQEMANNSLQVRKTAHLQAIANHSTITQKKENNTGLPDHLKTGIENLSGYSMDDVKVHYNSAKPIQLNALAYAQGTDIHLATGQERHLPHEAWHVVQQKQGRVKPTIQMKGKVNINDDAGLEKEADVMGAKAYEVFGLQAEQNTPLQKKNIIKSNVVQAVLNIANVPQEEITEEQAVNESIRNRLNEWRENEGEFNFGTIERAIEVAEEYNNLQNRFQQTEDELNEEYINQNWREIEMLLKDASHMYENDEIGPLKSVIYESKWNLYDRINEVADDNDNLKISDDMIFQGKRKEIMVTALNDPQIPEVAGDNTAGLVANAMNSDDRVGHLSWVQGDSDENTFRAWVSDETVNLNDNSAMNCWEAIFYSAFRANLMTRERIVALYENVNSGDDTFLYDINNALSPKTPLFDIIENGGLQRGDIILTTGWPGDHVAMSLGGEDVLSLWNKPEENLTLQRTTLRALVTEDELNEVKIARNSGLFVAP